MSKTFARLALPALTPDEWFAASMQAERGETVVTRHRTQSTEALFLVTVETVAGEVTDIDPAAQHALAALCLHEHLLGFTTTDVALLLAMGAHDPDARMPPNWLGHSKDLAQRISALLCPRVNGPVRSQSLPPTPTKAT